MAAPGTRVLKGGGLWIKAPTSLTVPGADSSYGGTILGTWHLLKLHVVQVLSELRAEEYGGELVDQLYRHESVRVSAELGNWDTSGVQQSYSGAAAGAGTVPLLTYPTAAHVRGSWQTDKAGVYLLAAHDTLRSSSLLLYNAYPILDAEEGLDLGFYNDLRPKATWQGVRDGSGRVYTYGLLAELSL